MSAGHPVTRLAHLPVRPGFTALPRPDLPAGPVAPLHVGAASLATFGIPDPIAPGEVPRYDSMLYVLQQPTVVSGAGIVVLRSGEAIEDTLDHTDPGREGYMRAGDRLFVSAPTRHLPGRYLSLLLGNAHTHYHWLVLNLARLALLDPAELAGLDGTLIPAGLAARQREWLALTGVGRLVEVGPGEAVTVDTLVVPWNVASPAGASVRAMAYLRGWAGAVGSPVRLYVDRRNAPARRLLNEAEVIAALRPLGFDPVVLERMPAAEQVSLFARAEAVVAPHGAGLANIAFARPGTQVVELLPSGSFNWCYRHMAAACGHRYDAVVGRSLGGAADPWVVAPTHVLSALER